jgi:hypothetical protein
MNYGWCVVSWIIKLFYDTNLNDKHFFRNIRTFIECGGTVFHFFILTLFGF